MERSFELDQRYLSMREGESHELLNLLQDIPRLTGCKEMIFLPVYSSQKLICIWMLATRAAHEFNKAALQPYVALAEFASTTLSKIEALDQAQQQLKRLQILNSLGQVIATELELNSLFQSVHRQVSQLFGDTGFYIALYDSGQDTINFPYLFEDGELLQLAPIPLGEGLTSIVIRSRAPLLLVGETERLAQELGAKLIGKLAKSWLGVPLMIGDQVLGVMTVQDVENDHAFSEEDASLLTTLASQVSVAIRNARLVESIRKRAEQQRILFEITEKIRRSVDMDTILSTTTTELAKALGARRAQIELRIGESRHDIRSGNGKEPTV
jgi:transcriptional regulator with GAF, ATPase, and Fis domain